MSFIHLHPGKQAPEIVNAIIEIPTGSRIKYVTSRSDLPPHFLLEVEHFFLTYKDLERKTVSSDGWGGKDEAHAFVRASIEAYTRQQKS